MSGSTLIVAINALMLRRTKLARIRQPDNAAAPGMSAVAPPQKLSNLPATRAQAPPTNKTAA
jgi:Cu2+-exporting ATPase